MKWEGREGRAETINKEVRMASFRFIHTADAHIDSPLIGLTRHEGSAAERIRSATREAFDNLIGQAIDEDVAFVVIAGDLFGIEPVEGKAEALPSLQDRIPAKPCLKGLQNEELK